jgi:hypothetical protein
MNPEQILEKQSQKWNHPENNARYVRWEAALAAMYEYARTPKYSEHYPKACQANKASACNYPTCNCPEMKTGV